MKVCGHLRIMYGNIVRRFGVAKITRKEGEKFEGPARIFDGEFDAITAVKIGPGKTW